MNIASYIDHTILAADATEDAAEDDDAEELSSEFCLSSSSSSVKASFWV